MNLFRMSLLVLMVVPAILAQETDLTLNDAMADRFASMALKCVRQEFPNRPDHVLNKLEEVKAPRLMHPAFYGCYDWHSSVHGHWMLIKLLREHPGMARAADIRAVLDENLSPDRIATEVAYLHQNNRKSFERTYGWAWLLKLEAELLTWEDTGAQRWSMALKPLADELATQFQAFLLKQTYPIRNGIHPNTAFSLELALEYAQVSKNTRLEDLIRDRARTWFLQDRNGPLSWEPGGEDFLSPCLEEAALMARVLPHTAFRRWFDKFLPEAPKGIVPAVVSDRTDSRIVHLDGLNLSRARALHSISKALGPSDPRRSALLQSADFHARASLPHLASGSYEGEHWLATFAVRMLAERQSITWPDKTPTMQR